MKLDKEIEPLPADSTAARAAALGARAQVPRAGARQRPRRACRPARRSRSARRGPRCRDRRLLQHVRRQGARGLAQLARRLRRGLAGRGRDLNTAIAELRPLLADLEPVAANLADPADPARPLLQGARRRRGRGRAGGRAAGRAVREPRHHLHGARLGRPALPPGVDLRGAADRGGGHPRFPAAAPLPAQQRRVLPRAAAGRGHAAASAPILADAFEAGTEVLPKTPPVNERARRRVRRAGRLLRGPAGAAGVDQLTRLSSSLRPTLDFLTPVQTICNYATLFFRNARACSRRATRNGTWQRFHHRRPRRTGPTTRSAPRPRPANGPAEDNHLHTQPLSEHGFAGSDAGVRGRQRALRRRAGRSSATRPATRAP